jgi:hypothetical protein
MIHRIYRSILLVLKIFSRSPRLIVFAYIDPNTGGMLFQLLAVLFGVFSGLILVFSSRIKNIFYRTMRFLRGARSEEDSDTSVEAEN